MIMLATHYDTLLRNDIIFVGADDARVVDGGDAGVGADFMRASKGSMRCGLRFLMAKRR